MTKQPDKQQTIIKTHRMNEYVLFDDVKAKSGAHTTFFKSARSWLELNTLKWKPIDRLLTEKQNFQRSIMKQNLICVETFISTNKIS